MSRVKKSVQIVKTGIVYREDQIYVCEKFIRARKIQVRNPIELRTGAFRKQVTIVPVNDSKNIRMSQSLADSAGLHQGASVCLHYNPTTNTLSLGPIIGVFISRVYPKNPSRVFGAITDFCKEMHNTCKQYGAVIYFFTPNDIQDSPDTVDGWIYTNRWRKKKLPSPDVIYNRLTSRKYENRQSVQHFIKEVKSLYNTSIFNEKYLNKTEVFSALRKGSSIRRYLPESYLFRNFEMLKTMMSKYPIVFLKPITGSLGKGIIKVIRRSNNFECHFSAVNQTIVRSYPNLNKAYQAIQARVRLNRYQIQQGIQLITVNGRPVDFRALVQRNATGSWELTSIVGRIAGSQHFVSNLARGGTLRSVGATLGTSNLKASSKLIQGRLRNASLRLAQGVETHIKGHYAELGIDLAVEPSGRVWLLEINSKPSKDDTPLSKKKIRPSVRKSVQYARYLAKF